MHGVLGGEGLEDEKGPPPGPELREGPEKAVVPLRRPEVRLQEEAVRQREEDEGEVGKPRPPEEGRGPHHHPGRPSRRG